jgi:hypothetical protein
MGKIAMVEMRVVVTVVAVVEPGDLFYRKTVNILKNRSCRVLLVTRGMRVLTAFKGRSTFASLPKIPLTISLAPLIVMCGPFPPPWGITKEVRVTTWSIVVLYRLQ